MKSVEEIERRIAEIVAFQEEAATEKRGHYLRGEFSISCRYFVSEVEAKNEYADALDLKKAAAIKELAKLIREIAA